MIGRAVSGRTLRRWMRQGNLSYDGVGSELGVHPITVRNWEKEGMPKIASLAFRFRFRSGKVFKTRSGLTIGK